MSMTFSRRGLAAAALATAAAGPAAAAAGSVRVGRHIRLETAGGTTGWTPFVLHREGQIFLPAQVNGVAAEAFLDSGVSRLVLGRAFAERAGLKLSGSLKGHGVTGSTEGAWAKGPLEVRVGSLVLTREEAAVFDTAELSVASARSMDLFLGREVFDALLVDIDFPSRQIAFHDPRSFSPPRGAVAVPLRPSGQLRSVPVSIEDRPPVPATFDLGNNVALKISPKWAGEQKLLDGKRTTTASSVGINGGSRNTELVLSTLEIGGFALKDVPVAVTDSWANDAKGIATPTNIGLPVFSRFRIVTDYGRDRLWLIPSAAAMQTPFRKNRSGLRSTFAGDRLRVLHVSRGGPAERLGWKEGEEIVAVDGVRIDAGYVNHARSFWGSGPAGTTVRLTMADGSVRQLTLEDYF
jgi:predicted aspartyl protease